MWTSSFILLGHFSRLKIPLCLKLQFRTRWDKGNEGHGVWSYIFHCSLVSGVLSTHMSMILIVFYWTDCISWCLWWYKLCDAFKILHEQSTWCEYSSSSNWGNLSRSEQRCIILVNCYDLICIETAAILCWGNSYSPFSLLCSYFLLIERQFIKSFQKY